MKRLIAVTLATFTTIGLLSGCAQDNTEDVSRISELEAQVGSLEDSMSSLESEKEELDSKLSGAESEIDSLTEENERLTDELSEADSKNKTLEGRIDELEALLDKADDYDRIAFSSGNTLLWNGDSLFIQRSDGRTEELQDKYVNSVAASPDGSKAVWTNFVAEGSGAAGSLWIYELSSTQPEALLKYDDLPANRDIFYAGWLDDRYILFILMPVFGTIAAGGDALYFYDTETGVYAQLAECEYTSNLHPELTSFSVFGDSFVILDMVLTDGNTDSSRRSYLIFDNDEIHSLIQQEDAKIISAEDLILE